MAAGLHYGSTNRYPLVPGADAVARTTDGRLVYTAFAREPWGTMAEQMTTPFDIELPAGADPLAIAAGMNPGASGWLVLTARREETGALGTVLVLGATGMSGRMAVQAALALGADHVIAAGRDPQALHQLDKLGATTVSLQHTGALGTAIAATPPSLVLDYLWGPVAETTFDALRRTGLEDDTGNIAYVSIGTLAGADAALPSEVLRSRRIRITGSGMGSFTRERMFTAIPEVMAHIADGTLTAPYTAYPLARVDQAWAHTGPTRAVIVPD